MENAVEYSDDNGTINLTIFQKHAKVFIEVINTCDLVDISDLHQVFDRFYRMEISRSRTAGGTGIGLSDVKAIIQAHSGSISVKSHDRKEICFIDEL